MKRIGHTIGEERWRTEHKLAHCVPYVRNQHYLELCHGTYLPLHLCRYILTVVQHPLAIDFPLPYDWSSHALSSKGSSDVTKTIREEY
jgi:hypothetical protein